MTPRLPPVEGSITRAACVGLETYRREPSGSMANAVQSRGVAKVTTSADPPLVMSKTVTRPSVSMLPVNKRCESPENPRPNRPSLLPAEAYVPSGSAPSPLTRQTLVTPSCPSQPPGASPGSNARLGGRRGSPPGWPSVLRSAHPRSGRQSQLRRGATARSGSTRSSPDRCPRPASRKRKRPEATSKIPTRPGTSARAICVPSGLSAKAGPWSRSSKDLVVPVFRSRTTTVAVSSPATASTEPFALS